MHCQKTFGHPKKRHQIGSSLESFGIINFIETPSGSNQKQIMIQTENYWAPRNNKVIYVYDWGDFGSSEDLQCHL